MPESEAGAQCGNSARWDLCGGPPVRAVPTAIVNFDAGEAALAISDPLLAVHTAIRARAVGATLCLASGFEAVAAALGAPMAAATCITWPGGGARTHVSTCPPTHGAVDARGAVGVDFAAHRIRLPHGVIALRPIRAGEETVVGLRSTALAAQTTHEVYRGHCHVKPERVCV